jgi:hypothetical protein
LLAEIKAVELDQIEGAGMAVMSVTRADQSKADRSWGNTAP